MSEEEVSLSTTDAGDLASNERALLVGELERELLAKMPAADAEPWDRTGMLVGNPMEEVRGVAVALDPTVYAVEQAHASGANVLLTHHPVFLDAPTSFIPASAQGHTPGAVVRLAIELGVSIISFHTALDVSSAGLNALPALLRLVPTGVLEPKPGNPAKGFGCICQPAHSEEPLSLRYLSARCVSVFGSLPRVWGSPERTVSRICTSGGSAGSFAKTCLDQGIDCLVCGEIKYHEALDAAHSGLAIIELGHDISEFPLCALLATYASQAGVSDSCITMIDQSNNWYTPETSRR